MNKPIYVSCRTNDDGAAEVARHGFPINSLSDHSLGAEKKKEKLVLIMPCIIKKNIQIMWKFDSNELSRIWLVSQVLCSFIQRGRGVKYVQTHTTTFLLFLRFRFVLYDVVELVAVRHDPGDVAEPLQPGVLNGLAPNAVGLQAGPDL